MASPILAMIGAMTLFVLGAGALVALVILSVQGFMALFRAVLKQ
jgi:hypothetical protein